MTSFYLCKTTQLKMLMCVGLGPRSFDMLWTLELLETMHCRFLLDIKERQAESESLSVR